MIKMLKIDPKSRISPDEIMSHPFCSGKVLDFSFYFDTGSEDIQNVAYFEKIT